MSTGMTYLCGMVHCKLALFFCVLLIATEMFTVEQGEREVRVALGRGRGVTKNEEDAQGFVVGPLE